MRDEGTRTIRNTSIALVLGSLLIAFLNLFTGRSSPPPPEEPRSPLYRPERDEPMAFTPPLEQAKPILREE